MFLSAEHLVCLSSLQAHILAPLVLQARKYGGKTPIFGGADEKKTAIVDQWMEGESQAMVHLNELSTSTTIVNMHYCQSAFLPVWPLSKQAAADLPHTQLSKATTIHS